MTAIVDANVLVRLADPSATLHGVAREAVILLDAAGEILRTLPQSLFEFWVVVSRPREINGLGLSVAECKRELARLLVAFPVLDDPSGLTTEWLDLVTALECKGKIAHDARYVAAMIFRRRSGSTRPISCPAWQRKGCRIANCERGRINLFSANVHDYLNNETTHQW